MSLLITTTNEEKTNNLIYSVTTQSSDDIIIPIKDIYNSYTVKKAENELKYYLNENEIRFLEEKEIDIRKLISLIRFLEELKLYIKEVEIVTEDQNVVFVKIVTDKLCDMRRWTEFTKRIKEYLRDNDFSDITKVVAILCNLD